MHNEWSDHEGHTSTLTLRNTHTHTHIHTQSKLHALTNHDTTTHNFEFEARNNVRSNGPKSSSTLRFSYFEPLQLEFFGGIKHGFQSNSCHRCILHTHELLIGYEYGLFHINSNESLNLKQKLNGGYSVIEAQTMRLSISESNGVEW